MFTFFVNGNICVIGLLARWRLGRRIPMLINRTQPCHHAQWIKPVAIHLPLCPALEIYSPLIALDMLMYRWPEDHGPEYEAARRNCLKAIAGQCDLETARESFLIASNHAHVLNMH